MTVSRGIPLSVEYEYFLIIRVVCKEGSQQLQIKTAVYVAGSYHSSTVLVVFDQKRECLFPPTSSVNTRPPRND